MFDIIMQELETRGIPWDNLIGFASDTANVMVGKHNSVLSRILDKQSKVFRLGCVCHLAALCATAGLKQLPVSIDIFLLIYTAMLSTLQKSGLSIWKYKRSSKILSH